MTIDNVGYVFYNRDLLLLSRFSRVQLCATPETAAHQAPPSLAFSRQEHWSGFAFPSPIRESEKWKRSGSVVSDSLQSLGPQPTRLLHPWDSPGKSTGMGCHCLLLKGHIKNIKHAHHFYVVDMFSLSKESSCSFLC